MGYEWNGVRSEPHTRERSTTGHEQTPNPHLLTCMCLTAFTIVKQKILSPSIKYIGAMCVP